MKTLPPSTNETLIMSAELEDRLSYLREKRTSGKPDLCFVSVPGIDVPFKMIGWGVFPDIIIIESPEYCLHHFFDIKEAFDVSVFGSTYSINASSATHENGIWKVSLSANHT